MIVYIPKDHNVKQDTRYNLVGCTNKKLNGVCVVALGWDRKTKYYVVTPVSSDHPFHGTQLIVEEHNLRAHVNEAVSTTTAKLDKPTPFTQEQLQAAFAMVQNKLGWKYEINKVVENPGKQNLMCVREAITHFTGSVPTFLYSEDGLKVHIRAAGYYATIGA